MSQGTHLILQVAADADRALSGWADRLGRDRYLELGSDPRLIRGMERELEQMSRRLEALNSLMKLGQMPMRQVNSYFAACGEMQKATDLLRQIRRQDRGSMSNTAHFLNQLESCRQTFHEMIALLQLPSTPRSSLH